MLPKFRFHFFITCNQPQACNEVRKMVEHEHSEEAMIQMDFAENYKCMYQDEVTSAHWKTSSITLFTVMIWFCEHKIPMIIATDNSNHDKTTVLPYILTVFNLKQELFGDQVKKVSVWTDGPSSQFKSKFICNYIGVILPQIFPD